MNRKIPFVLSNERELQIDFAMAHASFLSGKLACKKQT